MRIALTHNLKISDTEEEAEFDTPDTINAIAAALERLGHTVERVEVSGPASRTVARLEAYNPDLVFNTAEGRRGKFREAFYPALFEELGIPFTGSDAYALAVTLDKHTTKMLLAQRGVLSPRGILVEKMEELQLVEGFRFPVMVKPNFEGSSKGITQNSVVEEAARLHEVVVDLLRRYPAGVLVEEYIAGRDVTVPFVAAASRETKGVLTPVEYVIAEEARKRRKFNIYDYELKSEEAHAVGVRAPAQLPKDVAARLMKAAAIVYDALDIKDLGRCDFRVGDDGQVYFLEVNALPSLEPGAGIFVSAELEGLHYDAVLGKIVESACARHGVDKKKNRSAYRKTGPLRVGFTFNVKRLKPGLDGTADDEAEYDPPSTLQAIREAIASYGHEVIDLEATNELPNVLANTQIDVVFNMAEGFKGRNRESQVPALLELLDIPYSGSDPATLAIALDKALAKRVVRQHGILTPNFIVMQTGKEKLPRELATFPLIVKPNAEGSSKGVHPTSVVRNEQELRDSAKALLDKYKQPVLVEQYISGREFTVGLLGERKPRVLPPMEIVFLDKAEQTPVYSFEFKQDWNEKIRYDVPAKLEPVQQKALEKASREAFAALGCRDLARLDFRMDVQGRFYFIECNPLPGLTPDWSDLVLISKAAGMDYRTLMGEILAPAIRRYHERARERRREEREEQRPRELAAVGAKG